MWLHLPPTMPVRVWVLGLLLKCAGLKIASTAKEMRHDDGGCWMQLPIAPRALTDVE